MVQNSKREIHYTPEAYGFLLEALARTRQELGRDGHVSGAELLSGIRDLAADRYGPLAAMVFCEWGIKSGSDFGHMVYELVDRGVLFRQDEDSIEDFFGGKSYERIFEEEYFSSGKG